MIPFRYKHSGSDISGTFDQSQQSPYETRRSDSFNENFINTEYVKRNTNYLGTGSLENYGTNRSIQSVPNKQHADWMVYGPTPKKLIAMPEYDDFWDNQGLVTQNQLMLDPSHSQF